ncbi:MAG: XrtA system polysaccharide deacetylase [Planctomycetia bacterium]
MNILTIDVEEAFQVTGFTKWIPPASWPRFPQRVVGQTYRALELLAETGAKATFFIVGWVARRHPQLIREIAREGHEIAAHSYWHRLVYELTPAEFEEDLVETCRSLEDAAGLPIRAYRAPSFSIGDRSAWAYELLAKHGVVCDSSCFPIHHPVYGRRRGSRSPHTIETSHGPVWVLPISTARVAGVNLPVAGGAYLRLLPTAVRRLLLARSQADGVGPTVVYFHPWELDPRQPRLAPAGWKSWKHYVNLGLVERRLRRLLQEMPFTTVAEWHRAATLAAPNAGFPAKAAA